MTKMQLIEKMAEEAGIPKKAASTALEALLGGIKKSLKKGDKITVAGFGSFAVSKRKARKGRNPQTGAIIKIAASKTVKFKAGKALKSSL